MGAREREAAALDAQRLEADRKVEIQRETVARLNGALADHPEEQHLLFEMLQNQAAIRFNRALFDDEEGHQNFTRERSSSFVR